MKIKPAYLYLLAATLIWGANSPIMKVTLLEVPVFSLAFIRMAAAAIILYSAIARKVKIEKKDILTFVYASVAGVTLNLSLFFFGLQLSSAINASLLIAAVPIFTVLGAHFYLKEKLGTKIILASAIAFAGVVLIIGKPDGPTTLLKIIGNILLLLSSLSWVAHELFSKKLLRKYESSVVTFWVMAIGAVSFLPFAIWDFIKDPSWMGNVSTTGELGIIYGIIFASLIAYLAWQKGLTKLAAGEASFFFYLDPVTGVILSIILLGEKLTTNLALGGALILVGVALAEYKRKNHPLYSR